MPVQVLLCDIKVVFVYRANEPALSDSDQEDLEVERADRSLFVQDLIVSSLGSISIRRDSNTKHHGLLDELLSLQEDGAGACGGDSPCYHKPDILDANNEDIEVISLETQDDKDS